MDQAEERNQLEDKLSEIIQPEEQKLKRIKRNEEILQTYGTPSKEIMFIGVPGGKEKEKGVKSLFI